MRFTGIPGKMPGMRTEPLDLSYLDYVGVTIKGEIYDSREPELLPTGS